MHSRKRPRGTASWTFYFVTLTLCHAFLVSVSAVPSFNRTEGTVQVGSCEGLKRNVELGLDMAITITSDLVCTSTIELSQGQDVTISAQGPGYAVVIAEDFSLPDPNSATLLVNPSGAYLSLEGLTFANEAGVQGSPGAVRALWNAGTLLVDGCTFQSLNYASMQDGGAIYNWGGSDSSSGALTVMNSTFFGNVARDYGGAIAAWGEGSVDIENCTFYSNEALGVSSDRRAGSGGAVYASPGTFVTAVNSTFEACLARYGGAALFLCGGEILHTKFLENEADGLFGAVVNGDLSDEQKENASVALGSTAGTNYTCPLLKISLSSFHDNLALNGYGGAVASVDAKLSVWNSTMTGTTGGALYFGTSNEEDRNQIDLERLEFNENDASDYSEANVASAFLIERTGLLLLNATEDESTSGVTSATVQAQSSSVVVGTAIDVFCYRNNPYECEGYFAQAGLVSTGAMKCSTCEGGAYTGIGTPGSAPTPAPFALEDDDGLSKMGQERAQGGTPSPGSLDFGESSSSSNGGGGSLDRVGAELDRDEAALLGATGDMRWVVVGLLAALGAALLICISVAFICRGESRRKKMIRRRNLNVENAEEPEVQVTRVDPTNTALVNDAGQQAPNPSGSPPPSTVNPFFAVSPGTSKRGSIAAVSSIDVSTPLSIRRAREIARQRVIHMSELADARAESGFWPSGEGWAKSGPGMCATPSSRGSLGSLRGGFSALQDDDREHGSGQTRRGNNRGRTVNRSASTSRSGSMSHRDLGRHGSPRGRSRSRTPEYRRDRPRGVRTPASGARMPISGSSRGNSFSGSPVAYTRRTPSPASVAATAAASVAPPVWAMSNPRSVDEMLIDLARADQPYTRSRTHSRQSSIHRSGSMRSSGSQDGWLP